MDFHASFHAKEREKTMINDLYFKLSLCSPILQAFELRENAHAYTL